MAEQQIITDEESNAYLEHYYGRGEYPCYPEEVLTAEKLIVTTAYIDEYTDARQAPGESHSLAQLTRYCTARQKQVIRLARDSVREADRLGRSDWQAFLAERLGVGQPAVSRVLTRATERIQARRVELSSREPMPSTWAQWRRMIRQQQMLVYHRPPRGWISAYLHEQRWMRRRRDRR